MNAYIELHIDMNAVHRLQVSFETTSQISSLILRQLEIDLPSIQAALLAASKLKIDRNASK